jgi:anhydro-N-acetylmuramic acid kinase
MPAPSIPAPGAPPSLFVGLMSGTSLDGIDAVLADFAPAPPRLIAHHFRPFPNALRDELTSLCVSGPDEIERSGLTAQWLTQEYAATVQQLLAGAGIPPDAIRAVGAHGQTVRHRPELGFTLQLNAPALLAELTGIDVIADFRSRDLAAGGQGAPLVPAFHAAAFSSEAPRAVVNLGGISNLTGLPGGAEPVIGFDCGPGNLLLDAWTRRHFDLPFDSDGRLAASAAPDPELLGVLLAEPYFELHPPKSTGRELFSLAWLDRRIGDRSVDPRAMLATLTRLTAVVIGRSIGRWFPQARDVVVCGGGANNITLVDMLRAECAPRPVLESTRLGIAAGHVEALAFAWLAHEHLSHRPGNLPSVTGARGTRLLGALYPAG